MKKGKRISLIGDIFGIVGAILIFIIPFLFMGINALKDRKEANLLNISLPSELHWENFVQALSTNNYQIITGFKNSIIIVIVSVTILVVSGSMSGYAIQRRNDRITKIFSSVLLVGLMVPAAILPTIWVLQKIGLYKTLGGMILVEAALQTPFTIMLYRGFMSSIPIELEEAGYIDGCSKWKLYSTIIFPLLKPVTATVVILTSVSIFNDFTNPLYFLPGTENTTIQLTLYNFMGQFSNSYNLLFANVILITIPMLILFIFFNKKIVDGMVSGAVKG